MNLDIFREYFSKDSVNRENKWRRYLTIYFL